MNPDEQQQKVIAKGVTEGILKAVRIVAVVGLIGGIVIGVAHMDWDFSSGTDAPRGMPVTVLVVNETSDTLLFSWRDKGQLFAGQHVIPPTKGGTCERFYAAAQSASPIELRSRFAISAPVNATRRAGFCWAVKARRRHGATPYGSVVAAASSPSGTSTCWRRATAPPTSLGRCQTSGSDLKLRTLHDREGLGDVYRMHRQEQLLVRQRRIPKG